MATDIGIVLSVDGEKSTKAALANVRQEAKELAAEMKLLVSGFGDETDAAGKAEMEYQQLGRQIKNQEDLITVLTARLNKQTKEYAELGQKARQAADKLHDANVAEEEAIFWHGENSKEAKEAGKATQEAAKAADKATAAYIRVGTELSKTQAEINTAAAAINQMRERSLDLISATDNMGDSLENAGKDSLKLGDLIKANLISDAIKSGFQALVSLVKSLAQAFANVVVGVVKTGTEFAHVMNYAKALSPSIAEADKQLSDLAKGMALKYGIAPAEVAEAYKYMALAGWDAEQMLSGLEPILQLVVAGESDLQTVTDNVTDFLTAFGYDAQFAGQMASLMTVAMSDSNTTTEQLGQAYGNVASTAKILGADIYDVTAVLATMANQGEKGAEAGTHLGAIMKRIAANTSKAADRIEELGVEVYDADGNVQSFSGILQGLSEKWVGLTDEEKANLATTIAGQRAFDSFMKVMDGVSGSAEEGAKNFEYYKTEMLNSGDAAEKMATAVKDDLQGSMDKFNAGLQVLAADVFEYLNPALKAGMDMVNNFALELINAFETGDFSQVGSSLAEGWENFKEAAQPIVDELLPKLREGIDKVSEVVKTFVNDHKADLEAAAKETLTFIADIITDNAAILGQALATVMQAAFRGMFTAAFTLTPEQLGAAQAADDLGVTIDQVMSPVANESGKGIADEIASGIENNKDAPVEAAGIMQEAVENVTNEMVVNAYQSGVDFADNFANGMVDKLEERMKIFGVTSSLSASARLGTSAMGATGSRSTTVNLGGVTMNGYTPAMGSALVNDLNRQLGRITR